MRSDLVFVELLTTAFFAVRIVLVGLIIDRVDLTVGIR